MAVAFAAVVALTEAGLWTPSGAGAAGTAPAPVVPLDSLIVAQPLPGFTAAPTGPTNGPLTATEFASQSADPAQAEQQFDTLAAQPGFGASIRLWTDRTGTGTGANDVVVLLFRIADRSDATAFEQGLYQPFDGASGSTAFTVPSVPGAHGTTITVTEPVDATEQVVVFGAGRYVAMIEAASSSSPTNTASLSPAQATTVSYEELTTLRTGDPANTVTDSPTTTRPVPRPPPVVERQPTSATPAALVLAAIALVVLVAAAVWLVLRRRRRAVGEAPAAAAPGVEPWGPGGVFEHFGVDGAGVAADAPDQAEDHAEDPRAASEPRAVPELEPSASEVPVG